MTSNVRLAMQCAVDRQEVLDTAALGEGTVVGPITSPAYLSDPSARPCPERDVEKAKQYLADAGYADGDHHRDHRRRRASTPPR